MAFKLASAFLVGHADICSIACDGSDFYVGLSSGELQRYRIAKHIHRDTSVSIKYEIARTITVGQGSVVQVEVCPFIRCLAVLCAGTISLHNLDNLAQIRTVPTLKVNQFCVLTDGTFQALCVNSQKSVYLYDMAAGFEAPKHLILPTVPQLVQWSPWGKSHLVVAYRKDYSVISTDNGVARQVHKTDDASAILLLPNEQVLLTGKDTAVILSRSYKVQRQIKLKPPTYKFAFSFPYMVGLGPSGLQIFDIVELNFSSTLPNPDPGDPFRFISCDGKEICVATKKQAYLITCGHDEYRTHDPANLRAVRKTFDEITFTKYFDSLLCNYDNAFCKYLGETANEFKRAFPDPEEVDLETIKKHVSRAIYSVYTVVQSYFTYFRTKECQKLLYSLVQKNFYKEIYWSLFAIMTFKFKQQDRDCLTQMKQNMTLKDLQVPEAFWLCSKAVAIPSNTTQPADAIQSSESPCIAPEILENLKEEAPPPPEKKEQLSELDRFEASMLEATGQSGDSSKSDFQPEQPENATQTVPPAQGFPSNAGDPYLKAIEKVQTLSEVFSPKEKIVIILDALNLVIECINNFWGKDQQAPILGAEELVPIYTYILMQAGIPKIYSELNFIYEFATDDELAGKWGYSFATFQIGVEDIANGCRPKKPQADSIRARQNSISKARSLSQGSLKPEPS